MPILKQALQKIALGAAIVTVSVSAHATSYAFDTGTPSAGSVTSLTYIVIPGTPVYSGCFGPSPCTPMYMPGPDITIYSSAAATFSLDSSTTIDSIEAYLAGTGKLDYVLRAGSPSDTGWSTSVPVYSRTVTLGSSSNWYGLTGLNLSVSAGTYTLSFLPSVPGTNGGLYQGASSGPDSLTTTWKTNTLGGALVADQIPLTYGIRVGEAAPAPVPAPLPILGAVAAIGWSRKLRRRIRESQALAA